ncbi:hypothetical protein BJ912DRAFT_948584, partial [Pholiota molesta]
HTAQLGLACYSCYTSASEAKLQRCSRCRRVAYCSSAFCNALYKIENDPFSKATLSFSASNAAPQDPSFLNMFTEERIQNEMQLCKLQMRRPLTDAERELLVWEPRCLACGQSERLLRMQNATPNSVPTLIPCKDCNLAFCCSDAHWEAVRYLHTVTPEDDVLGGLSQCKLNQRFHYDWALERDIYRGHRTVLESHPWRPKAKNTAWTSLKGSTWDIFFDDFVQQRCASGRLTQPEIDARFRAATDYLSLPMTTLYALEGMNDGSDWTRKETLVIHVLGAVDFEILHRQSMEQILHHLPAVSKLKILYCGDDLRKIHPRLDFERPEDADLCETCRSLGKKISYEYYPNTYHSYIQNRGDCFANPDLAIAFNSTLFDAHIPSWSTTLKEAVRRKIPTIFAVSVSCDEAKKEAKIIADAGGTLIPDLGPRLNPFGSMLARPMAGQITGFRAVNAWLSGAFRS